MSPSIASEEGIIAQNDQKNEDVFQQLWEDENTHAPVGRVLYLSRHGESEFNLYGRIGGNSNLSPQGYKYANALASNVSAMNMEGLQVWHSELVRTEQTAAPISATKVVKPEMNEINSGMHDGMTYEEIAEQFPKEFAKRDQDKLRYRYPGGESYIDVCRRLQPILPEMNKAENLLVICHQAVLRCVVAYLTHAPMTTLPYIKIPLHTIIEVTMMPGGENILSYRYMPVECVDTYRAKPVNCDENRPIEDAVASVPAHV